MKCAYVITPWHEDIEDGTPTRTPLVAVAMSNEVRGCPMQDMAGQDVHIQVPNPNLTVTMICETGTGQNPAKHDGLIDEIKADGRFCVIAEWEVLPPDSEEQPFEQRIWGEHRSHGPPAWTNPNEIRTYLQAQGCHPSAFGLFMAQNRADPRAMVHYFNTCSRPGGWVCWECGKGNAPDLTECGKCGAAKP